MHLGSGGEVLKLKRLQKNMKRNPLPDAEKSAGSGSVTADRLLLVAVFSGKREKKGNGGGLLTAVGPGWALRPSLRGFSSAASNHTVDGSQGAELKQPPAAISQRRCRR